MTGHTGARTVDATLLSATDAARIRAEEELHSEWQRKAVRVVAASARGADDCRLLLSILGITPDVVAAARGGTPGPGPRKSERKRREQAA